MKKLVLSLVLLSAIFYQCTNSDHLDAKAIDLLIKDITIIDVIDGNLLEHQDIAISKGIIKKIDKNIEGLADTEIFDGQGLFAIPGFWDMHVHTGNKDVFFPLYLANGITGVRDMGGDNPTGLGAQSISLDSLVAWRKAIEQGEILGPRLIVAGPIIDGPDPVYPGYSKSISTEEEAREVVRSIVKRGADFTKVYSNLTRELYKALADESKEQGIPFAGHVPKYVTAEEASEIGQKSMEHLRQIIENHNDFISDDLLLTLKKNRSWQVPTLTVYRDYKRDGSQSFLEDSRLEYIPKDIRQRWAKSPFWHDPRSDTDRINQRTTWNRRLETVKKMHDYGIPLLAGSDAANPYTYPGFSFHDELEEMVAAGLTPAEVLKIATYAPADFQEATDSLGSITKGKVADIVILSDNPLIDIKNIRQIEAVITRGNLLNRSKLDTMLKDVKRLVN